MSRNLNDISRREFVKRLGRIGNPIFKMIAIGALSFLLILMIVMITNAGLEGWKFMIPLVSLVLVLYLASFLFERIAKNYAERAGKVGRANLRALGLVYSGLVFSALGAMAMRAYYLQKNDSLIMWLIILAIFTIRHFREEKAFYLKEENPSEGKD